MEVIVSVPAWLLARQPYTPPSFFSKFLMIKVPSGVILCLNSQDTQYGIFRGFIHLWKSSQWTGKIVILIDGYHETQTPAPALIVVFSFQIHYNQLRNPVFSSIKMFDTVKCPHCKIKIQKSTKSIHVRGVVLTCWMPSWTCHYGSRPDGVEGSRWPSIWSLRPLLL